MALSEHINDIITAAKAMPNSYRRGRLIGKLDDALVQAKVLEMEDAAISSMTNVVVKGIGAPLGCICSPGMRDGACNAVQHKT